MKRVEKLGDIIFMTKLDDILEQLGVQFTVEIPTKALTDIWAVAPLFKEKDKTIFVKNNEEL